MGKRLRSPNYPNYDLKECVTFLDKFYKKYNVKEAYIDDAVKQMGHSPTSSSANRVLSSMFSFGLLSVRGVKENRFVSPTKLAQEIVLESKETPIWYELLRKAALNDKSMHDIWDKWGPNIPSEDTIKKVLQLEMKYSPEGAKRFASVIVVTYNFARLLEISENSDVLINEEEENKEDNISKEQEISNEDKKSLSSLRKANLLLPGDKREIVVYAPSDLTNEEFEILILWLQLQKFGLVTPNK
jgi:hypothetical protein